MQQCAFDSPGSLGKLTCAPFYGTDKCSCTLWETKRQIWQLLITFTAAN